MSCPFKHLVSADTSSPHTPSSPSSVMHGGSMTLNKIVTFMQGSPDAAFLLDIEGQIIYRNKAAQLMFLTNVNQMSLLSVFTFSDAACWDDITKNMTNSDPLHYDVAVLEGDGTKLDFRMNVVKLPDNIMGEANSDVFACAYVIPTHDHERDVEKKMSSIAEDDQSEEDTQLKRHMKDVVQASLDPMFCVLENGTIGVANDPAVCLFGYTHEELKGKDISAICPTAREVQNVLDFMNAPSINQHQITTATNKSGTKLSIELGLSLNQNFAGSSKPMYFANMKDLTALEEHKSEIEHKDNYCQAMINASFDPMFGIDQRGTIVAVNDAARQAFGYTTEEFMGQNIKMICNDRDAIDHDKYLSRYIRTGEKRIIGRKRPLVARRKNGDEFPIELGVSEVCMANGEKMFCGYVRDRTQEHLDKKRIRRSEAVIQDKFFQAADARGAMRKSSETGVEQALPEQATCPRVTM